MRRSSVGQPFGTTSILCRPSSVTEKEMSASQSSDGIHIARCTVYRVCPHAQYWIISGASR